MRPRLLACLTACVLTVALCAHADGQEGQQKSVSELAGQYEGSSDFAVKSDAVRLLAHHADPAGALYLGGAFGREKDAQVRLYMVLQLADAATAAAGEALLECGDDPDPVVASAHREALAALVRKPAFDHMVEVGLLRKKGPEYTAVKKFLTRALSESKARTAISILKKALDDSDWEVRLMAAESLLEIGTDETLREACRALDDRRSEVVLGFLDMTSGSLAARCVRQIMKALSSKDAAVRARAVEVLTGQGDGQFVRKCVELARDADGRVRAAAVEALKWAQDRSAIDGLLAGMKTGPDAVRRYAADALKALTGQDFGPEHAKWQEWWSANAKTAQLAAPPRPLTGAGKPTYYGTSVVSKNVIFIIDVSASMEEEYQKKDGVVIFGGTTAEPDKAPGAGKVTKIEVARRELVRCIKELDRDVKFNIIFYNHIFTPWQKTDDGKGSRIIPATPRNKREAIEFVMTFKPAFRTNIFDTLEFALNDKNADTIYLLSDGEPNEGRLIDCAGIISEIAAINAARDPGAVINTIGFGLRPTGKTLLKQLAENNGGIFLDL